MLLIHIYRLESRINLHSGKIINVVDRKEQAMTSQRLDFNFSQIAFWLQHNFHSLKVFSLLFTRHLVSQQPLVVVTTGIYLSDTILAFRIRKPSRTVSPQVPGRRVRRRLSWGSSPGSQLALTTRPHCTSTCSCLSFFLRILCEDQMI